MVRSKTVGITMLFIGTSLLVATFASAFAFLYTVGASASAIGLQEVISGAFSLLSAASVRAIYLGVMGWVGSILTARGVSLMKEADVNQLQKKAKPSEGEQKSSQ